MPTTLDLIRFIAAKAAERGSLLTRTRLVKFLYLADVFHARKTGGQILTGWRWKFHHYGPFCDEAVAEIEAAVDGGYLNTKMLDVADATHDVTLLYSTRPKTDADAVMYALPGHVTAALSTVVRKYIGNTTMLLDYVYFDTEPMDTAQPGDLLDFSRCQDIIFDSPIKMLPLSVKKLRRGRELLKKMKAAWAPSTTPDPSLYDHAYFEALAWWDAEESEMNSFQGIAFIRDTQRED